MTTKKIVDTVNAQSLLWGVGRAVCGLWPALVALGWLALPIAGMAAGYWVAVVAIPAILAALVALVVAVAAFVVALAKVVLALALCWALCRAVRLVGKLAQWAPKTGGWDVRPTIRRAGLRPVAVGV